jgi:uncharacterized protein YciI
MLFIVHGLDKPNGLGARLKHYEAHKAFLAESSRFDVNVVMSGPLTTDDGKTMIGSFFLLEAPNRRAVENFHIADPFYAAGIWETVTINAFLRRQG